MVVVGSPTVIVGPATLIVGPSTASVGSLPIVVGSSPASDCTCDAHLRSTEWDASARPYWYPCKTDGGSMRQDRLVLPIPPGVHWKDEMPILIGGLGVPPERSSGAGIENKGAADRRDRSGETPKPRKQKQRYIQFGPPGTAPILPEPAAKKDKPAKDKRPKQKCDPKLIAASRELRDRYLEHYNADGFNARSVGQTVKYDVSRPAIESKSPPKLPRARRATSVRIGAPSVAQPAAA